MNEAAALPVGLDVAGWRCVVAGGGPVGTRRVRTLLAAGADTVVVAPDGTEELERLATAGELVWERRQVRPGDGLGARVVVCATSDRAVNEALAAEASADGALVNRADDAVAGDLRFPATVVRGPLAVSVAAGGAPAVTRWAASRIDDALDDVLGLDEVGLALLVDIVREVRGELRGSGTADGGEPDVTTALNWRSAIDGSMLEHISRGRRAEAKDQLKACLSSS
jgi:siroheme synthase-like protein